MKIRTGLVSNSSSSSFFFCFRGKKNDNVEDIKKQVIDLILRHRKHFSVSDNYDSGCNALDIVSCVENYVKSRVNEDGDFMSDRHCVLDLDNLIVDWEKQTLYRAKQIRKYAMKKKATGSNEDDWSLKYDKESLEDGVKTLEKLAGVKERGMTTLVKLEFGDSHGITGPVGRAMDHNFCSFDKEDLVVLKFSNH